MTAHAGELIADQPFDGILSDPPRGAESSPLGIVDEATYQAFRGALTEAEAVRLQYSTDRRPRTFAGLAGLHAFAELNPGATAAQLAAFINAYDAALADATIAGDPLDEELRSGPALLASVTFAARVPAAGSLEGMRTDVADRARELLGLAQDPPDASVTDRQARLAAITRANSVNFTYSSRVAELLVFGLLNRTSSAEPRQGLRDAIGAHLAARGYEPFASGGPLDTVEYAPVFDALAALPADFPAYVVQRDQGFDAARTATIQALDSSGSFNDQRLSEIAASSAAVPGVIDAWRAGTDPAFAEAQAEIFGLNIRQLAARRAELTFQTLLAEQSARDEDRLFARQARDYAQITLETGEALSGFSYGLEVAGATLDIAGQGAGIVSSAASGDVLGALSSTVDFVGSIFGLVNDETGPPPVDEQIFDQVVALRQQVEDLRTEMVGRFDRVDARLDQIFSVLTGGLQSLQDTTNRIDENVAALRRDVADISSELRDVESRLSGLFSDLQIATLVTDINGFLRYRERLGVDLPFTGGESFSEAENSFFTFANDLASNDIFAPRPVVGSVEQAAALLGDRPDANINLTSQIAGLLTGDPLAGGRIVNPSVWAQAADAYAQLLRENPWYALAVAPSRRDAILARGVTARRALASARDPDLLAALEARYLADVDAFEDAVTTTRIAFLRTNADGVLGPRFLDPWKGVGQTLDARFPELFISPVFAFSFSPAFVPFIELPGVYMPDALDDPRLYEISHDLRADGGAWEGFIVGGPAGFMPANARTNMFYEVPQHSNATMVVRVGLTSPVENGGSEFEFYRRLTFFTTQRSSSGAPFVPFAGGDAPTSERSFAPNFNNFFAEILNAPIGSLIGQTRTVVTDPSTGRARGLELLEDVYGEDFVNFFGYTCGTTEIFSVIGSIEAEFNAFAAAEAPALQATLLAETNTPGTPVAEAADRLDTTVRLLREFLALGLPDTLASDQIVRAAVIGGRVDNSDAAIGKLGIRHRLTTGTLESLSPADDLRERFTAASQQWTPVWRESSLQEHAYLAWTIANLESLRDNGIDPLTPDHYETVVGVTLAVDPSSGLLANDADMTTVSRSASLQTPAGAGVATVSTDGSFTYTPNPGFEGTDTFTYTVAAAIPSGPSVSAGPEIVTIRVGPSPSCSTSDVASPFGALTVEDVLDYLPRLAAAEAAAERTGDDERDFFDLAAFLEILSQGCP